MVRAFRVSSCVQPIAFAATLAIWGAMTPLAFAGSNGSPPTGSVLVGQFTIGGCIAVCDTFAMCKDLHINEKNGDCWLSLDKEHPDFTSLTNSCPDAENRTFSANMVDDQWRLSCAD